MRAPAFLHGVEGGRPPPLPHRRSDRCAAARQGEEGKRDERVGVTSEERKPARDARVRGDGVVPYFLSIFADRPVPDPLQQTTPYSWIS